MRKINQSTLIGSSCCSGSTRRFLNPLFAKYLDIRAFIDINVFSADTFKSMNLFNVHIECCAYNL